MSFGIRNTGSNNNNSDRPQVDWKALNEAIVKEANLEQPETLVGIVAGIYDVGVQPQQDSKYEWTGTADEEADEIDNDPTVYFEDLKDYQDGGKVKRYKRKPAKPAQSVVFAIDFPDVIVDKGIHFGNSDPKPLRLILGGEFTPSGSKTVAARPTSLTKRKSEKTNNLWSLPFNNTAYKMAVAAKIVKQGEAFLPERLDELLGKAMQFKAQVFLNDGKYYTERCSFAASLGRGQAVADYDDSLLHIIQFDADNDANALNQLRASVKNTMRNALDFNESKIKDQIGEAFVADKVKPATDLPAQQADDSSTDANDFNVAAPDSNVDFDDDSIPF